MKYILPNFRSWYSVNFMWGKQFEKFLFHLLVGISSIRFDIIFCLEKNNHYILRNSFSVSDLCDLTCVQSEFGIFWWIQLCSEMCDYWVGVWYDVGFYILESDTTTLAMFFLYDWRIFMRFYFHIRVKSVTFDSF